MKIPPIMAIDVGGGTQDILLYDPDQPIENAVKLVLPSPTVIAARRVAAVTRAGRPLFLSGRVMGGGAVGKAVRSHIESGLKVFSLPDPALTLHDDLDKVASWGVSLVESRPDGEAVEVVLGDVDLEAIGATLSRFEVSLPQVTVLAIQDHGFSPRASNRLTRFAQWRRFLDAGGDIGGLIFPQPPAELTRWIAAARAAPGAFFMDTAAAALRGAILDDWAAERLEAGLLAVNVGNEHTVAALVRGRRVWGVYEHHTGLLDSARLADQMERFAAGDLAHEDVFDQYGHGVAFQPGYRDLAPFHEVVVTGPNRALALGLGRMAAPYGEMMLSGCFGLVQAVREHFQDRSERAAGSH
ncbi:MAG: DUF1786 domain-containing protein [Proteobacteria bacterium]|nr:DUF1786 domain-containing protein [Pseudomonadota bacterium]